MGLGLTQIKPMKHLNKNNKQLLLKLELEAKTSKASVAGNPAMMLFLF